MTLAEYRCNYPKRGKLGARCGVAPAKAKITQAMVGREIPPGGFTTQPVYRCEEHWNEEPAVYAMTGERVSPQPRWSND